MEDIMDELVFLNRGDLSRYIAGLENLCITMINTLLEASKACGMDADAQFVVDQHTKEFEDLNFFIQAEVDKGIITEEEARQNYFRKYLLERISEIKEHGIKE